MNLRTNLRQRLPIGAALLARRIQDASRFEGDLPSWEAAAASADGYDDPMILAAVSRATAAARDGHGSERDGSVEPDGLTPMPVLAAVERAARRTAGQVRVLDVGGALGSTYFALKTALGDEIKLTWRVVEQPSFVAVGQADFQTADLSFSSNLDSALADGEYDVAVLSSVLQYLESPGSVLATIDEAGVHDLLVDRTPTWRGGRDVLTVQTVGSHVYGRHLSYPARIVDEQAFAARLSRNRRIVARFLTPDGTFSLAGGDGRFIGWLASVL